jgi:dTDP-4-dehydrorhamnose reductase
MTRSAIAEQMKLLIIGTYGQLGLELQKAILSERTELGPLPHEIHGARFVGVDIAELNITALDDVQTFIFDMKPDVVINCAAYTDVDRAEVEIDRAFSVNALGARNIAIACEEIAAKLIHFSTDYVFDGTGVTPYREWDCPNPQSIYAKSKLLSEKYVMAYCKKHFIIRTAWLYGNHGGNFVKTIVKRASEEGVLRVINDQKGNPTNAIDLAHHVMKLVPTEAYGIYHATGNGICTWYDFACEIVRLAKLPATVIPCTTVEYASAANRPSFSALDNMALRNTVGDDFRPWKTALRRFFENEAGNL